MSLKPCKHCGTIIGDHDKPCLKATVERLSRDRTALLEAAKACQEIDCLAFSARALLDKAIRAAEAAQ